MTVSFYVSNLLDGSMKSSDQDFATVLSARTAFLRKNAIEPDDTTLVHLTYGGEDYCRYSTVTSPDKGDGITRASTIIADALVVTQPDHALLLPLADCIGAVIHDPTQHILMLSHLGRHNIEQYGGTKCIDYLRENHGCDPKNLTVWLSPAAGKENYPLYTFENRSLHDVATTQIMAAGVPRSNITISPIDVTTDKNYFSHSQFIKGNRDTDGRFAIVAVMH